MWNNQSNYDSSEIWGFTSMFISLSLMAFPMYKMARSDEKYKYKSYLFTGLGIAGIAAICYVLGWMVMSSVNPWIRRENLGNVFQQDRTNGFKRCGKTRQT